MELSERCIQKLEAEGFAHIFEWHDAPGTVYEEHAHQGKVALCVTDGLVTVMYDAKKHEVRAGERLDIPVGTPHTAVVGPKGAHFIVGEEIEGDS